MDQSQTPSSSVDASSFRYVVGVDIGSQTCSVCALTPDKRQVLKSTEFANATAGFALLCGRLEHTQVNLTQLENEIDKLLETDRGAKGLQSVPDFGRKTVAVLRA